MQHLENFSKVHVLIIGDVMIDRYWWGNVERISPEAPVPVVRLDKTTLIAGGAANVAANVAGLGATPYLLGIMGDDDEAKCLPGILAEAGISAEHLIEICGRPTTLKTRIVAHNQQIVRIDQETNADLSHSEENLISGEITKLLDSVDIIVVSDYAKGLLTENILSRLIKTATERNIKILVDPKGKDYTKYAGATLLTPNKKESAEACNIAEDMPSVVEIAGERLIESVKTQAVLITRGEEGMTLFERDKKPLNFKTSARDVFDVTGAGDTVIATLAVAIGAGFSLAKSAGLANIAAGFVVGQIGTTAIKIRDLTEAIATR